MLPARCCRLDAAGTERRTPAAHLLLHLELHHRRHRAVLAPPLVEFVPRGHRHVVVERDGAVVVAHLGRHHAAQLVLHLRVHLRASGSEWQRPTRQIGEASKQWEQAMRAGNGETNRPQGRRQRRRVNSPGSSLAWLLPLKSCSKASLKPSKSMAASRSGVTPHDLHSASKVSLHARESKRSARRMADEQPRAVRTTTSERERAACGSPGAVAVELGVDLLLCASTQRDFGATERPIFYPCLGISICRVWRGSRGLLSLWPSLPSSSISLLVVNGQWLRTARSTTRRHVQPCWKLPCARSRSRECQHELVDHVTADPAEYLLSFPPRSHVPMQAARFRCDLKGDLPPRGGSGLFLDYGHFWAGCDQVFAWV